VTHSHSTEHLKIKSYSSYDVALRHDVDIENVDFGDVVVAVDRDNVAIRYGSWMIVFADFALEDESEGFDLLNYYALTE
jgi:hypothetical protein